MIKRSIIFFHAALFLMLTGIFLYLNLHINPTSHDVEDGYIDLSDSTWMNVYAELDGEWTSIDGPVTMPDILYKNNMEKIAVSVTVKLPEPHSVYAMIIPKLPGDCMVRVNHNNVYQSGIYASGPSTISGAVSFDFFAPTDTVEIELFFTPDFDFFTVSHPIIIGSILTTHTIFARMIGMDIFLFMALLFFTTLYFTTARHSVFSITSTPILLLAFAAILRSLTINNCLLSVLMPWLRMDVMYIIHPITSLLFVSGIVTFTLRTAKQARNKTNFHISQLIALIILYISLGLDIRSYDTVFGYSFGLLVGTLFLIITMCFINYSNMAMTYTAEYQLVSSYNDTLKATQRAKNNYLSAHLKPHFLFNALNIISGYALFDTDKAKKVCDSLSTYFKEFFENCDVNAMNSLSNEIELLKSFGYIEEERFPEIHLTYDIQKKLPAINVPALIFQPLLENAINHGIRKKSSTASGHINVEIKSDKKYLTFVMTDDGCGFSKEALTVINNADDNDENTSSIITINRRLKELYNEKLYIKTVPGKGSEVSLKIPVKKSPRKE